MIIATWAFYIFSVIATVAGLFVVLSRNPVHSVLWLILTFFSAAGLFVLLGAEFVAMLMLIVYVGAVAVLFLFVVMMLDVDFQKLKQGMANYLPLGFLVGTIILIELGMAISFWQFGTDSSVLHQSTMIDSVDITNTRALGQVIYTDFALVFQICGLILLVAMIGAIVLTLRTRTGVKKQNVLTQMYRTREEAVELRNVKPGQGI